MAGAATRDENQACPAKLGFPAGQLRAPAPIRELRDLTRTASGRLQAHSAECQRIQQDPGGRRQQARLGRCCRAGRLRSGDAGRLDQWRARSRGAPPSWPRAGCAPSSPSCARPCGAALVATTRCSFVWPWRTWSSWRPRSGELDAQVDRVLGPFAQARDRLDTITRGRQAGRGDDRCRDRHRHDGVPHRRPPPRRGRAAVLATTPTGGKRRSGKPTRATAGWARC
jgi:hypothetical protein